MGSRHSIFRTLESKTDDHEGVVLTLKRLYEQDGKHVVTERRLNGFFIDV